MTASALGAPVAPAATLDLGAIPPPPTDHRDGPGTLRVDPRVVRKLAAQAAREVEEITRAYVAPISRAIHHPVPASTPPDQLAIDLELTVTVDYPSVLPVVVERLAAHVSARVQELTGRPVRRLGVHVAQLGTSPRPEQPRVR